MNTLRELARSWLHQRRTALVVEIAVSAGSVPREAGTRLLVAADEVAGTIGGGRLEFEAIHLARQALGTGAGVGFARRYALGPSLGQCCGGSVTLRFTPLSDTELSRWPAEAELFRLQLYGAGHVGREIVRALERLPVAVDWIDERDDEFETFRRERRAEGNPTLPANLRMLAVDEVAAEVKAAPPGSYYLILTHSHDLDMALCEAVLRRADFGFLGLIGSRTKRARFLSRLRQRGLPEHILRHMTCPIGIAGIRSKRPEMIAVAVVAQLLALASSRDGSAAGAAGGTKSGNQAELAAHTTP